MTQLSRGRRRGAVFSVRITEEERATLDALQERDEGPRALGPWLVWRALAGSTVAGVREKIRKALPPRAGTTGKKFCDRVILDLCGGSGSWAEPYRAAGYDVRTIDIGAFAGRQAVDARVFRPPSEVHGVLAAPPCTQFSMASHRTEAERDFVEGMSVVNACMRIILQCKPAWWALENPAGHLSKFIGTPRDSWEPCEFGDPWTKRTCIWGDFAIPERGPFVEPKGSAMQRSTAAARAITPPGFARAFFEANP